MILEVLRDLHPGDQREVRQLVFSGLRERWAEAFDGASTLTSPTSSRTTSGCRWRRQIALVGAEARALAGP